MAPTPPSLAPEASKTPAGEGWNSRIGVILAVAGSAVGLGNFLRFPGQAVNNGGGAFMVPYFVALLLLGIPIGWIEWTIARHGGRKGFHSSPGIFGVVGGGRFSRYLGVLGVIIPVVIAMYYLLLESWCLRYFWGYVTGSIDLGSDPTQFVASSASLFTEFTGRDADGFWGSDGALRSTGIFFFVLTFAINIVFVTRGLSAGIERFCALAMPVMAVAALVVLVRVLTLGTPNSAMPERNVMSGLGFMWNPDLSKLGDFKTWLAAASQIFFSLSVGFGIVINYASYLKKKDDVVLSGLTASATNEVFEVAFGGLITIPAAFVFLGASGATGGTFDIGFSTLPVVFQTMGGVGRIIGATWFLMLFLAAITSSLSMVQPAVAFLREALGVPRGGAVALVAALLMLGSAWVVYFSKGLIALDTMDFWVGTILIFVMAAAQLYLFVFPFGVDRGLEQAHLGARLRIPRIYRPIIKYVTPTFLVVVFVGFCTQNMPGYLRGLRDDAVARNTTYFIAGVCVLMLVLTWIAERRWKRLGLDLDGRLPPEDES